MCTPATDYHAQLFTDFNSMHAFNINSVW